MLELIIIIFIALLWALFLGELSLFNLTMGAAIAILLLSLIQRDQEYSFAKRLVAFLRFLGSFLIEMTIANIMIARLAFIPKPKFHPHIIAVPLRLETDVAIALLSATITLMPGTVAMGVSEDKKLLYAHAVAEADLSKLKNSVSRMESLILGFTK